MDFHVLSHWRNHHHSNDRLSESSLFIQKIFGGQRDSISAFFHRLLFCAHSGLHDRHARVTRYRRRDIAAHGIHYGSYEITKVAAANRAGDVRSVSHRRTGHRTYHWWLLNRKLWLAGHILCQRATQSDHGRSVDLHVEQSANATQAS